MTCCAFYGECSYFASWGHNTTSQLNMIILTVYAAKIDSLRFQQH